LGTTYILNVAIPTCSLFLWWRWWESNPCPRKPPQ